MAENTRRRSTNRKPAAKRSAATSRRSSTQRSAMPSNRTLGLGAAALGFGATVIGAFLWARGAFGGGEGHEPTDLMGDEHPGADDRAPEAFRPDMDAPMTAAEREALRPATGRPTLVANA